MCTPVACNLTMIRIIAHRTMKERIARPETIEIIVTTEMDLRSVRGHRVPTADSRRDQDKMTEGDKQVRMIGRERVIRNRTGEVIQLF